jgi:N-acetylglucosamine-6-phosphate deacetylase
MKTVVSGIHNGAEQHILIEDGIIRKVGLLSATELEGATKIDTGGELFPGFVDIHIHGGGGADTMDASPEAFQTIAQTHAQHGTTGLFLTTITESVDRTNQVMKALDPEFRSGGAKILGFHLEGPFINPKRPGAHPVRHILEPNVQLLQEWIRLSQGQVKLMTMAPEMPGAEALIRFARERGVVVSMGHSAATLQEAERGKEWGAQSITHLFNAMNGFHHRDASLANFGMADEEICIELIADYIHVHPAVCKAIVQARGTEHLLLITDAMRAACMGNGTYELGGQMVQVMEGKATLEDGTIAGSTLTIDRAVRNLVSSGTLSKTAISQVTSQNQSRLLGLNKGKLEIGFDGDIIALDKDLQVTHTIVAGQLVYRK